MLGSLDAILGPLYFWAFSLVAVCCALGVLTTRHPLHGAVCLIGVLLAMAGLYALLGSPYVAVLQVLVYAGAIMVLMVFVLMVLNQARDDHTPRFDLLSIAGLLLPLGVASVSVNVLAGATAQHGPAQGGALEGSVANLAPRLFDTNAAGPGYYLLFELIGVLLLVAIVAAVLLAKRSLAGEPSVTKTEDTAHGH